MDAVLDVIPAAYSVADIGTDHALLARALALRGHRVVATEVRLGPWGAARRNLGSLLDGGSVELRLGPGLSPLAPGEVDALVIAGMGGRRIAQILDQGWEVASQARLLLLQPMQQADFLLAWLWARVEVVNHLLVSDRRRRYTWLSCPLVACRLALR